MKYEIRKRINEVKQGEIPNGYKNSKFGIIPQEWQEDTLGNIGKFSKGKGIPGYEMKKEGIPCVGYGDIYTKYKYYFNKACSFVDKSIAEKSTEISRGTLLFTGSGETAEEIGKCVCYNGKEKIYAGGDIILFLTFKVDPIFVAFQQNSEVSVKEKAQLGQGHSIVHIYEKDLSKLKIVYPKNKEESKKISSILEKQNEIIINQENKIRTIKEKQKYLIEKLYNKKDRWKQDKLENIVDILSGYAFKSEKYEKDGKYKVITIANVKDNKFEVDENVSKIEIIPNDIQEYQKLKYGDILMSLTGNVGRTCIVDQNDCLLNQRVAKINVRPQFDKKFIYYYFQTNRFSGYMQLLAQGAAQDNLSIKDLKNFKIHYPESIEEQKEISELLDKINQITILEENKLDLLKEQQKVLIKLLLNGIVRVV